MLPRAFAARIENGKLIRKRSIAIGDPRLWTIGALGVLLTFVFATYFVRRPPTYWSRTQVLLVAPKSTENPNGLQITTSSLIATAGVISKMIDHTDTSTRVVSEGVTLVGEGVKHGYSVTVPNSGGQWASNFTQAVLDVQVVGSTNIEVGATANKLLGRIDQALATIQRNEHVADVNFIRTQRTPLIPPVYRQGGSRLRAGGATILLGVGLTAALVVFLYRRQHKSVPDSDVVAVRAAEMSYFKHGVT